MYEEYLAIYLIVTVGVIVYAMRKARIIGVSASDKLLSERAEMDRSVLALNGVLCPFCREPSNVKTPNFETWTVLTVCRKCGQLTLWKWKHSFMGGYWRRIAPFKYTPSPVNKVECVVKELEIIGYNYIIEFPNSKNIELFKQHLSDLNLSTEDIIENKTSHTLKFSCTQQLTGLDCLKSRGLIKNFFDEEIRKTVTGEPLLVTAAN